MTRNTTAIQKEKTNRDIAEMHWTYFLLLEQELIEISKTVELCEANYATFGPTILKLILSAGSELDCALKSFAQETCPDTAAAKKERPSMVDFKEMLLSPQNIEMLKGQVQFLHTGIVLQPWKTIFDNPEKAIEWWDSYNKVKHHRNNHYEDANIKNALEILAALFVITTHLAMETKSACVFASTELVDHYYDFSE